MGDSKFADYKFIKVGKWFKKSRLENILYCFPRFLDGLANSKRLCVD